MTPKRLAVWSAVLPTAKLNPWLCRAAANSFRLSRAAAPAEFFQPPCKSLKRHCRSVSTLLELNKRDAHAGDPVSNTTGRICLSRISDCPPYQPTSSRVGGKSGNPLREERVLKAHAHLSLRSHAPLVPEGTGGWWRDLFPELARPSSIAD